MKLHLANTQNRYAITAYGAGFLTVNGVRYEQPLIVSPDHAPRHWPVAALAALDAAATAMLLHDQPEIVILGTGPDQQFTRPEQIRPLLEAGIGLELMSTPAACRTYNILMGEGRRVLAAILLP